MINSEVYEAWKRIYELLEYTSESLRYKCRISIISIIKDEDEIYCKNKNVQYIGELWRDSEGCIYYTLLDDDEIIYDLSDDENVVRSVYYYLFPPKIAEIDKCYFKLGDIVYSRLNGSNTTKKGMIYEIRKFLRLPRPRDKRELLETNSNKEYLEKTKEMLVYWVKWDDGRSDKFYDSTCYSDEGCEDGYSTGKLFLNKKDCENGYHFSFF